MNIDFNDYEIPFSDAWDDVENIDDIFKSKKEKKEFISTERKTDDKGYWAWWRTGGDIEKVSADPFYDMYYFKKGGVGKPLEG
jgi:hypothetical protein|tara:strand:+ start:579 stop:827 length:249 start_codon:yes stop_codon:yes gene_type:complete